MSDIVCGRPDTTGLDECPPIPAFDFHISPNISLGHWGSIIVLLATALPAIGIGLACAAMGHWPVAIFSSLSFGGLLVGFIYARRSLRRLEHISVSEGHVVIERSSVAGLRCRIRIPLFGLHVERFVDPDYGVLSLVLRHRDQRTEIARDLSPAERERFGAAFACAINAAGLAIPIRTTVGLPHQSPEPH